MSRPHRIKVNAPTITDEDRAAVDSVLRSGWIGTGPETASFEEELRAHLGAEHVVCLSSCTAALELTLEHLEVGPHTRVGVPSWTYVASALPAVHRGAEIVLVDSDPDTLGMSPESLEQALRTGLDVVVPVHLGGIPLPRSIWDLAREHGALVVEDGAHAFGAATDDGPLRGDGSVGIAFSFHATKNLTCGEGGAVATSDAALAEFLRGTRLHGLELDTWAREESGTWIMGDLRRPGHKANMPDVLAALGRSQLTAFPHRQCHRRSLVERYRELLAEVEGLRMVPSQAHPGSSDHLMIVLLDEPGARAGVVDALAERGISTGLHYTPLHQLTWFAASATPAPGGLPVAEDAAGRALTLPLHGSLTLDEVDEVCESLAAALDQR